MIKDDSSLKTTKKSWFFYGYVIVIAALFLSIFMWGTRHAFGVFFAPVLDEFGWTRAMTSGGFSATWILTGLLSIFVGRLNDRFGPRVIMTVAGLLLGLGYMLMYTLNSIWQLYLLYGIISVGMSAALVPPLSTVARWFVKMRAFMTGIVLAGTGIALVVILPTANALTTNYGWRLSYVMVGAMVLVVVVIAAQFLKRDPYKAGALPYGYEEAGKTSSSSPTYGVGFRDCLRTNQVWLISTVYFCSYLVYYVFVVHMIIYATGQGISPAGAVTVMSVLGAAGIAGRILMGIFADRIGSKQSMMVSAVVMMVSLFWLLAAKDLWSLCLFSVIFGFGHGGIATMESPMTAHIFGMRSHGVILGLVFFFDTLGGAIGPVFAGYVFDVTASYQLAFLGCAIIGIANLIAILLLKPIKNLPENT